MAGIGGGAGGKATASRSGVYTRVAAFSTASSAKRNVVIVEGKRTPIGSLMG